MNKKIDVQKDYARLRKVNRNLVITIIVLLDIACLLGWGANELWKERKEFMCVEWLYRYERGLNRDMNVVVHRERQMLHGTSHEVDSLNYKIPQKSVISQGPRQKKRFGS